MIFSTFLMFSDYKEKLFYPKLKCTLSKQKSWASHHSHIVHLPLVRSTVFLLLVVIILLKCSWFCHVCCRVICDLELKKKQSNSTISGVDTADMVSHMINLEIFRVWEKRECFFSCTLWSEGVLVIVSSTITTLSYIALQPMAIWRAKTVEIREHKNAMEIKFM